MPTTRSGFSTSVVNGQIYAIGGIGRNGQAISAVEAYDPMTDTWTKRPDMPTARAFLCTNAVNGKIYAIGGSIDLITVSPLAEGVVEEYDTGFRSVEAKGKLATTWGEMKLGR